MQHNKFFFVFCFFITIIFLSDSYTISAQTSSDTLIITRHTKLPIQLNPQKIILINTFKIYPNNNDLSIQFISETKSLNLLNATIYFVRFPNDTLLITYQSFPILMQEEYRRYTLKEKTDSIGQKVSIVENNDVSTAVNDIFTDTNLRKSGSFVRGITIGSNRDMTLNSGFRMEMEGNLTDDVEVSAVLTDENIPIQPEGNTQTLSELDKVYVQLRSEHYNLTLGDYLLNIGGTHYANYNRKLQGIELKTQYPKIGGLISFANSKGKYFSNSFIGVDGNQGPYRLTGKNNERFIIVLAGSERVYLNGIALTRGESNDYVIDYSSGEITFTQNILISSASRITVDFEYSDRLFARDFITSGMNANLLDDHIQTKISFVRESDNKNAPIDFILSDTDKQTLKSAGNNTNLATRSGIDSIGYDLTTGKALGNYAKRDTTISTVHYTYYNYQPGTNEAVYRVTFTDVGIGNGSYTRKTIGYYEFTGPTKGNYEPIIFLPVPTSAQLLDMTTKYFVTKNLTIQNEWAMSSKNNNLFANPSTSQLNDFSTFNAISYITDSIFIGNNNFGIFENSFSLDYQGKNFNFIDREKEVDYNRNWGIENSGIGIKRQLDFKTTYKYSKPLWISYSLGKLNEGSILNATKHEFLFTEQFENWLQTRYNLTSSKSDNQQSDQSTKWLDQKVLIQYPVGQFNPSVFGLFEDRQITSSQGDSLYEQSFKNYETEFGLEQSNQTFSSSIKYKIRTEEAVDNGIFFRSNQSQTQSLFLNLRDWNSLTSQFNLTNYQKEFSSKARLKGNSNTEALLVKWTNNFIPFKRSIDIETDYSVNTQKTSKYDRIFIKVQRGYGNYIWIDRNGNGIEELDEFEPTRFDDGEYILRTFPSDELIPIIDLKTSIRLKLKPNRSEVFNFLPTWLQKKFSTETFLAVDEKSNTKHLNNIYLLRFSKFMNDSTTMSGSQQIIQDIFYDESNRNFNLRFRYLQRKSLTQFALDSEHRMQIDRSLRAGIKVFNNIYSQTDMGYGEIKYLTSNLFRPSYQIKNIYFIPDLSYRTNFVWEVGLKSLVDYRKNFLTTNQSALIWSEIIRYNYTYKNIGRFRAEFEMTNTTIKKNPNDIVSYDLSSGNPDGKLYVWRTIFDYKISDFISSYFSYDGRLANNNPPIHTMRAEIRAFF